MLVTSIFFFSPIIHVFKKLPFSDLRGKHRIFLVRYLPNNQILNWSKFKAFADDKTNVPEKLNLVLGRLEDMVGKGENVGC